MHLAKPVIAAIAATDERSKRKNNNDNNDESKRARRLSRLEILDLPPITKEYKSMIELDAADELQQLLIVESISLT